VPLAGSRHEECLQQQIVIVDPLAEAGARMYAPVANRGEAIGVLEITLPGHPDDRTIRDVLLAAHLLGYAVIVNRRFTDLFRWGQRSVPLSLAAEIQHRLVPGSFTCETEQFTLAAWLEPARADQLTQVSGLRPCERRLPAYDEGEG
jgi:hypothetical protein